MSLACGEPGIDNESNPPIASADHLYIWAE